MRRACIVLGILAFATVAHAEPRDPVKADQLFREGQRLLGAGDFAAACPKLADSYALDPALGTLLNLAFCHEKEGRGYTAYGEFRRAAAEATRTEQKERATFAKTRAQEIAAKMPRVHLEVASGARITILRVDGAPVDGPFDDDIAVPTGTHTIDAETIGGEHLTKTLTFDSNAVTVVRLGALHENRPPRAEPPVTNDDPGSGKRTLGLGLAGVGVIALGAGTYFGIATFSKKSDADAACAPDGCTAQGKHDGDLAHTYATVSTILIGAGIVAAAAGLYLVLTAPSARTSARAF